MRTLRFSLAVLTLSASVACTQYGNAPANEPVTQPASQPASTGMTGDPDKIVQSGGGVAVAGWQGRVDPQAAKQGRTISDAKFATMGKGLHLTSGPAAIFWDARNSASGNYSVSATFTQMKPATHAEGYGLVVAGSNLAASNQSYIYFLIRQDGKYMVNHRANDSTVHKVVEWTENAAVNKVPAGGKSTNSLRVAFTPANMIFYVNDIAVQKLAKSFSTSGIAGLRVNHNLDVHVDGFAVASGR